eukprot:2275346-Lingulodinium_polyedra.AAC.1
MESSSKTPAAPHMNVANKMLARSIACRHRGGKSCSHARLARAGSRARLRGGPPRGRQNGTGT